MLKLSSSKLHTQKYFTLNTTTKPKNDIKPRNVTSEKSITNRMLKGMKPMRSKRVEHSKITPLVNTRVYKHIINPVYNTLLINIHTS